MHSDDEILIAARAEIANIKSEELDEISVVVTLGVNEYTVDFKRETVNEKPNVWVPVEIHR